MKISWPNQERNNLEPRQIPAIQRIYTTHLQRLQSFFNL